MYIDNILIYHEQKPMVSNFFKKQPAEILLKSSRWHGGLEEPAPQLPLLDPTARLPAC